APVARGDDGKTLDLLGREEVGLDERSVVERDARATVEARMRFEPVKRGERRLVDLIHLAGYRVRAAAHETRKRSEVPQLERGLRARVRDKSRASQDAVVRLTGEERAVDEDARGCATLAPGRAHGDTPAARARGSTSKPRRAYACQSTMK